MSSWYWVSKIVIIFLALTVVKSVMAQELTEVSPEKRPFEWVYRWAIKAPEIQLINKDGKLIVSGTNIEKKQSIIRQLEKWSGLRAQNFLSINWNKDIDATQVVSAVARQLRIGEIYPSNGLNCHATSLYLSGLLNNITHVVNDELDFYLDNYCQKISRPEVGAIGVLDKGRFWSHSYKIIGPNIIFEKKSVERTDAFKFHYVRNFGNHEFFRCHFPQENRCIEKYRDLSLEVNRLDRAYSYVFKSGDNENYRGRIIHLIEPLLNRIEANLKAETEKECQLALLQMKVRVTSLKEVSEKILGWDLYREGVGRLIYRESPL